MATIQSARAVSTRALYTLKWRSFERWCAARQHDPINCALGVILEFLQQLFDEGKAASTLKVYMAAISACHAGINGSSPGSHPLASRFMAGVRRLRVPERHLIPSWDLLVVLRALTGPPFEPLETVDIKFVSLKTALLLALTSAKRVGDMQALSVSPSCLQFSIAGDRVVMRPNAAYTPKVVVTPFRNQVIELAVFSPPPFASAEEERLNKLCPVRALRCYAERTRAFRQSDQLFVCFGARAKGRPLSKPSLSRWIVEAIVLSYKSLSLDPPEKLHAHSTRGVSSSWALLKGVSVEDICKAASWSSRHTFIRFYMLDVAEPSFLHSVLRASDL